MSGISLAWRAALIATKNSRVSCVVQENCLLQQVPLKDLAPPVAAGAEFGCQDFESDLSAFQRRREDAREASCAIERSNGPPVYTFYPPTSPPPGTSCVLLEEAFSCRVENHNITNI